MGQLEYLIPEFGSTSVGLLKIQPKNCILYGYKLKLIYTIENITGQNFHWPISVSPCHKIAKGTLMNACWNIIHKHYLCLQDCSCIRSKFQDYKQWDIWMTLTFMRSELLWYSSVAFNGLSIKKAYMNLAMSQLSSL